MGIALHAAMAPQRKVLIVDDDRNGRAALAELLREEGWHVATAGDGPRALALLDSFRPDVLLTDLRMPGMDGLELLLRLRAARPRFPAVVMSVYTSLAGALRHLHQDIEMVAKPIDLGEVVAALERAIAAGPAGAAHA